MGVLWQVPVSTNGQGSAVLSTAVGRTESAALLTAETSH